MPLVEPKDKSEFDSLLAEAGDRLVVVKFFATWCGPCRMMGPKFQKLSDEFTDILCIGVDVDEQDDIVGMYEVNVMPTFMFIKGGSVQHTIEGTNAEDLRKNMESRK